MDQIGKRLREKVSSTLEEAIPHYEQERKEAADTIDRLTADLARKTEAYEALVLAARKGADLIADLRAQLASARRAVDAAKMLCDNINEFGAVTDQVFLDGAEAAIRSAMITSGASQSNEEAVVPKNMGLEGAKTIGDKRVSSLMNYSLSPTEDK